MKNSLLPTICFLFPFCLNLLTSCGPRVDSDTPPISSDSLPRTPRPLHPVSFFEKGPYLHVKDEFVNDTLYNYFEIRTRPSQGDSLIYRSRYFPSRPSKSRLFVTRKHRIWWYNEGIGTMYWQEENGQWTPHRYAAPWDSVPPAPDAMVRYAPRMHPH